MITGDWRSGDWLTLGAIGALAFGGVVRRRGSPNNDCDGPFFHTTTWDRLDSIANDGLVPGYRSRFGGWYQTHSRGRLFVAQGMYEAGHWFDRVSSVVEMQAELREEDEIPGVVSVMLRLDLDGMVLEQDEAAKADRRDCAFYVTETVEPERIWFYDGSSSRWRPIDEWDESDPMAAVRQWSIEEEEDDEWSESWIEFTLAEPWDDEPGAFAPERHNDAAAEQQWDTQKRGSRGSMARWSDDWWKSPSRPVHVHGDPGRIFRVGQRLVLAFDRDLNDPRGYDPQLRWSFEVKRERITDLSATRKMEWRYRRNFPDTSAHRYIPPSQRPWEKLKRGVESDLQRALDAARRR